jgi:hypothetical protein
MPSPARKWSFSGITAEAGPIRGGREDRNVLGIRTCVTDYNLPDALPCPEVQTPALAATRLKRLDAVLQERLINGVTQLCDAAMRRHRIVALNKENSPMRASGSA